LCDSINEELDDVIILLKCVLTDQILQKILKKILHLMVHSAQDYPPSTSTTASHAPPSNTSLRHFQYMTQKIAKRQPKSLQKRKSELL
jgi:hypothetical protein